MAKPVAYTLAALFLATVALGAHFEPWILMWILALEMFVFFKWTTLAFHPVHPPRLRSALYLFGWVGMDPAPFLKVRRLNPDQTLLLRGLGNVLIGVIVLFSAAQIAPSLWLLQGWVIGAGLVLILHFGCFDVLTWLLRRKGIAVEPLMNNPLMASSIADFWGKRWNSAFKNLVMPYIFRPLRSRIGAPAAVWGTFLFSGLVHEAIISVPAHAGWGLPLLYFLIQPLGIFIERSNAFQKQGPIASRLFTYVVVAGPAVILFHPPFIRLVILPFARAIGVSV